MSRAWGFPSGSVKWLAYVQCALSRRAQTFNCCLQTLSHDAAVPGAWAGGPRFVSDDTNNLALLLWISWFCLVIILGGRTWKRWASASITEIMCNSSELTLLLNKPTVGVRLLFPPSSILGFRFSAVLTDIGDCIIAFCVKTKLSQSDDNLLWGAFWRHWSLLCLNENQFKIKVFKILHMPSSLYLVSLFWRRHCIIIIIAHTQHQRSEQLPS